MSYGNISVGRSQNFFVPIQKKLKAIRDNNGAPKSWVFSVIGDELRVRDSGSERSISILSIDRDSFDITSNIKQIDFSSVFTVVKDNRTTATKVLESIKKYMEDNYIDHATLNTGR